MAGIEVGADFGAYSLPQPQQRLGIVNAEAGMQLQCNLMYTMCLGKGNLLLPVRNQHLIPLVFQRLAEILRPGAGHPVGGLVLGTAAGTAGKGIHHADTQLFSQQNCVSEILFIRCGHCGIRMDHIAVGTQRADFQAVLMDGIQKILAFLIVLKQFLRVAVGVSGAAAAADFYHLNAVGRKKGTSLVQRESTKRYCKYA